MNIRSRSNKNAVLSAIISLEQKLKLYHRIPKNGLALYCGIIENLDGGGEKKINIDFEPLKPLANTIYQCDNQFHTEALREMLSQEDDVYGFIILDGNGCLFATLQGNHKTILSKFSVDLPKKHHKGGQSALRFARLRLEKRGNYIRKCLELAIQAFISSDRLIVKGIILAGIADLKIEFHQSTFLDYRLKTAILKIIDLSYGMEAGLHQAIELSMDCLSSLKLIHEKELLQSYYHEIDLDTKKYFFMIADTMTALEMNAIDILILWENLSIYRIQTRNPITHEEKFFYLTVEDEESRKGILFYDAIHGVNLEILDRILLIEWFLNDNYLTSYGKVNQIQLVSDRTPEGSQFCRGFGGIGGILRWRLDFLELEASFGNGKANIDSYEDDDDVGDHGKGVEEVYF